MTKKWKIYLSGEIHSDWRERIQSGITQHKLNIDCFSPITDHAKSDDVGATILGTEENLFWHDNKAAKINSIRIKTLIQQADIIIVRFGDKYKQWNAAFDAGFAIASGKPIITLHVPELTHALKEVDAAAQAVCETPEQVVEILKYTTL